MHPIPPKKIIAEREVAESPLTTTLRRRLPAAQFQTVERVSESFSQDPSVLEVVAFRGRFLKSCPGTKCYFCCGYKILHFGIQCTLECSYCILQAYLNQPNLRLFGNTEDMLKELEEELHAHPDSLYRIGTGEFTDSMLLDPWTELSRTLAPFFSRQPNAVLELKTKTSFIDNLSDLDHGGHCITAWSLNAPAVSRREEPKAASIRERLKAAQQCSDWGYKLAFHFDPMIDHPGRREGYLDALRMLLDSVDSKKIVWISLGAFRFMPELKAIIQSRHPKSRIPYGEFIRGLDGKMRYFREIRVELYALMAELISRIDPDLCVYLCMEGRDIWRDALGFSPEEKGGLPAMLDQAVKDRMGVGL